ncbi:hypothetical protein [Capnocytophaga canimorsus]|uniref:hypothetical protein n=1 Tax=Capnocytophaga canimorsus TaxID=28188 RepID=UPI000F5011DB|nr:hypothetical protein [Capnocytophaga canimorsus]
MKGILNFKGIERTLISFRLPHRRRIDTSGYPCSLPRDSFFYVSFLAEEGDDFFMQWMCGKNIAHGGAKGFWHDGEIVFYDETSDGQEFYRYDLQYVMPIHFRLEYDHQNGMVIHLTLTALDRVYNHLLHTENFYGYFFEYAKPKERPKPMPKEEPVVYVRDFDADKEEAQPNEKVTYKVTKYSQEKVTENDKKSIQWAIKIDGKQEVLKEKGEKLVLTIKEEWAGKEIIVMPFLVKPTEKVSKKTRVIQREILIIVGTEQSTQNMANRLMFPAMAVRKLRTEYSDYPFVKVLIFTDGYTEGQLNAVEYSFSLHNKKVKIIRVNSTEDVVNIINTGNISATENNVIRKIASIYIYSHGYIKSSNNEGVIAFGYKGKNADKQELDITLFSKIKKVVFLDGNKTHLYSYACRTGIGTSSDFVSNPKKDNSLAQKMANFGGITVFAYMKRSLYEDAWGTQTHRDTYASDSDTENSKFGNFKVDIKDLLSSDPNDMKSFSEYMKNETRIEGAIWNVNGAYLDVKAGEYPKGVSSSFDKYIPKK